MDQARLARGRLPTCREFAMKVDSTAHVSESAYIKAAETAEPLCQKAQDHYSPLYAQVEPRCLVGSPLLKRPSSVETPPL